MMISIEEIPELMELLYGVQEEDEFLALWEE